MKLKIRLLFLVLAAASTAQASSLTLTTAGSSMGFTLTPWVTGFKNNGRGFGPTMVMSTSSQNVLVTNYGEFPRNIYSFDNFPDGQSAVTCAAPSTAQTPGCDALTITPGGSRGYFGITSSNGQIFAYDRVNSSLDKLNDDGSYNSSLSLSLATIDVEGLATNAVDQHIYAATRFDIRDINPSNGTVRIVTSALGGDGLVVSPDGKIVYVALAGGITGFDTATGAQLFHHAMPGADGIAVIQGFTSLAGQLIVLGTDGNVTLIDPNTPSGLGYLATVIASGTTRGDLVGYDLFTGSLFLTTSDSVERLTCPSCIFTSDNVFGYPDPNALPEPLSLTLLGLGLAGLALVRRKHL